VTVSGYLLPLSEARRNKKGQFFFLNHRPIDDQLVTRAVRDGFGGFPNGLHPVVYLFLEVEPALVDVNVHPAKREVRFRRPSDIVNTIIEAVSQTLSNHARGQESTPAAVAPEPELTSSTSPAEQQAEAPTETAQPSPVEAPVPQPQRQTEIPLRPLQPPTAQTPLPTPKPVVAPIQPARSVNALPAVQRKLPLESPTPQTQPSQFSFKGMLQELALFESKEGLMVLQPKAAIERIIFEQLLAKHTETQPSQLLLDPVILELDPRDYSYITSQLPAFERAGMTISSFGQRTIRIESLPAAVHPDDTKRWICDFFDQLTEFEGGKRPRHLTAQAIAQQMAHRAALGEKVSPQQIPGILEQLLKCEVPYCTPAGYATMTMFSLSEIRKRFK
jgi:DNA mismatch repair protein MutL